jgi:hypothetical protein
VKTIDRKIYSSISFDISKVEETRETDTVGVMGVLVCSVRIPDLTRPVLNYLGHCGE